ncbi:hypothetical protein ACQPU1_12075 [Clostridium paraputrificum]|uniref:hypothetical protein n=1 Tax=Clostridium paraputrificum TaxID=29363 RepID=UPI003D330E0C
MSEKYTEVDEYLKTLIGTEKDWVEFFVNYMRKNHSDLEEVISFKMPTYKLGSGKLRNYIAFSPAKNHFSMHSMDFEYISLLKEELKKPGKGKGCVNVPYGNEAERSILIDGIDKIISRNVLKTYGKKDNIGV